MFESVEAYNSALSELIRIQVERYALVKPGDISSGAAISASQVFSFAEDKNYTSEYKRRLRDAEKRGVGFPFDNLTRAFCLSDFEAHAVLLAYMCEGNPITLGFAVSLFKTHTPFRIRDDFIRGISDKLFRFFFAREKRGVNMNTVLTLHKRILEYIAGLEAPRKFYFEPYKNGGREAGSFFAGGYDYENCDMDRFFNFAGGNGKKIVCLYGEAGTGRRTAVKRFADEKGKNILFIDTELFKSISPADLWEELGYLIRECLLENALPCFYHTGCLRMMKERDMYIRDILLVILRDIDTVFFIQDEYDEIGVDGIPRAHFEVRMPGRTERALLWGNSPPKGSVPPDINIPFLANAFALSPKQIEAARHEAFLLSGGGADMKTITACCYHQTVSGLAETADKVPAAYGWGDIILPPETKKTLWEACNHIKYSDVVLEKWGMKRRAGYGVGLNIMFAGPPGTGKTMAAQVAANELNMDLYRIDTSKIVSKYIGETEKHLRTVFDEGRKANVILFFDEMDSLFGARTEIKDAHDKYANMQTAYILQRIEEYEGVILMATNLKNNVDEAFMRRIQYVLYFTLPAPEYRRALWEGMFPREAPFDSDIDFEYLAENYEISGGVIKNIVISAAFYAAAEQKPISMKHVVTALQIELAKQGKVLIKEDLGRYSHYFAGF